MSSAGRFRECERERLEAPEPGGVTERAGGVEGAEAPGLAVGEFGRLRNGDVGFLLAAAAAVAVD